MPLLAVFQQQIGRLVKLEMQTGLFFAYGVGGYTKWWNEYRDVNADGSWGEWKAKYFYLPNFKAPYEWFREYKRFDAGINFGLGVNIWRCYVGCAYDLSLTYDKGGNHCGMVNLGYTF